MMTGSMFRPPSPDTEAITASPATRPADLASPCGRALSVVTVCTGVEGAAVVLSPLPQATPMMAAAAAAITVAERSTARDEIDAVRAVGMPDTVPSDAYGNIRLQRTGVRSGRRGRPTSRRRRMVRWTGRIAPTLQQQQQYVAQGEEIDTRMWEELADWAERWAMEPVSGEALRLLVAVDRAAARRLGRRPRLLR